jgi:hypothetical protein
MTGFEFLSVMISIIFGIGLTHVLAGTMRYIYAGRATELRLFYSLFALIAIFVPATTVRRLVSWWFLFSIVTWALVVRRFLA